MAAIALRDKGWLVNQSESRERGKHSCKLRDHLLPEIICNRRNDSADVIIDRVDKHRKRQITLEFRGSPGQHEVTASIGLRRKLGEQPRLPDSRFPDKFDRGSTAIAQGVEIRAELAEFLGAADDVRREGHVTTWAHHKPNVRVRPPESQGPFRVSAR